MIARRRSSARVVARGAEHAERAGVGVDERDADGRARRERRAPRRRARSRLADALAQRPHARADAREAVVGEIAEPDLGESSVGSQRSLVTEVRPLAHGRAERTRVVAGRAVGQEVGEIEEVRGARASVSGRFSLQPEELRRLHLGRDRRRRRSGAPHGRSH